ncbi:MAG: class I SAM-dependent methyltransferase [Pseudomonadales bacterium]|nr:class I SAM-dependent methyltransferase [Pseudomonadales bacterium]
MKYKNTGFSFDSLDPNDIDRIQLGMVRPESRVLEIGCANGFMSEYMVRELGCDVVGIEIDEAAAVEAAKHCSAIIHQSIEEKGCRERLKEIVEQTGGFDVVLMSQVIEHIAGYQDTLLFVRSLLKPGGELLISTVNVAHWTSRLRLLVGIWRYEAYGLFDEDHLRFFTPKSLREALEKTGFEIIDSGYSVVDFNPFLRIHALRFFNIYSLIKRLPGVGPAAVKYYKRLFRNVITWQFVYRATPTGE